MVTDGLNGGDPGRYQPGLGRESRRNGAIRALDAPSPTPMIVEHFNNRSRIVATVNFSVPDDVKAAFGRA